jgi:hypothetical protein
LICFGQALLVGLALEEDILNLVRFGSGAILLSYFGWLTYWAPSLEVTPDVIIVKNPFRTVRINLAAVTRIDTRFALSLFIEKVRVVAWAAPAPGRHLVAKTSRAELSYLPETTYGVGGTVGLGDLPNSDSGAAAYLVRTNWQATQARLASGDDIFANDRKIGYMTQWHFVRIAIFAGLATSFCLGIFIG